ncbi:hypothetical protein NMY22_g4234 [Coprinellus aureogranulatus]|nr:hypothetical protein NMY22_g4234 [Coprinellus aureogranulatus]
MAPNTTPTKKATIWVMKKAGYSRDMETKRTTMMSDTQQVGPGNSPAAMLDRPSVTLQMASARNATDLQQNFFPNVHVSTLKQELCHNGLGPYVQATVPFATRRHVKERLMWVETHSGWEEVNWNAVMFCDELIFRVFGSDGLEWCWRRPEERFNPMYTKKKLKHSSGKVTVWGMIMWEGVGRLVHIYGNLNSQLSWEILEDDALGSFTDLNLDPRDYYFQ